jgi:serine/alanine adding enzyme
MMHIWSEHQFPGGLFSPDVYFTPGYGRAVTVSEGGQWVLLEAFDGAWQVPLIVRTLADGTKDAITPHFSGVYASPCLSPLQIQHGWSATVRALEDLGVISLVLRDSPLLPHPPHLRDQQSLVTGHPTVVLEPVDNDSAWSGMVKTNRTKIRKALKNGYTGDVRAASSADLASGGDFRRLYEQTMRRVGADPVYFFSDQYYQRLREGLGANLLIAEVRDTDGVPVAADLLMRHGARLHGHLSGSNHDDARMGTSNLAIWATIQFAVDQGLRQFHIGGGITADDSLFTFKRSFGGSEVQYGVSGLIIDDGRYHAHVQNRAKECDTTSGALLGSNYFPAYRAGHQHLERPPEAGGLPLSQRQPTLEPRP